MDYAYTPASLTRDGKPWTPVMGEMHYSRVPAAEWARSLELMKAGGVDIVSSYVIWIHHEEVQGDVSFAGDLDLRRFVETARDAGLLCWLRIGPWIHGEVRNGGLPDWLLHQDFEPRTNDERYFAQVERFYRLVAEQLDGLFEPQGGPIIGIQIENEYGHCGGLPGPDGEAHMRRLYALARAAGFDVPYFSATGWGGACTGGLLPLMGGYAEAPWDPRLTPIEPSGNFVITPERNDHNVGSDLGVGAGLTFDPARFPYLTAELGGGLQVTEHRRPVARPDDVAAMSVTKLASGASMLGYYM
jgi:beta-galactosidase GanA